MAANTERLELLLQNDTRFTGIDFVDVVDRCEQTTLRIFFLTDVTKLDPPLSGATKLLPQNVVITSPSDPRLPPVTVLSIDEVPATGGTQAQVDPTLDRSFIVVHVSQPGTFAPYQLHLDDPNANADPSQAPFSRFDRFFNDVSFSFKVGCDTDRDCAPAPLDCPPDPIVDFPVDYLARDFVSFENALLDFAAQRYPQWTTPITADVGVMLAEVFAALGDELSYIQDRYAREAFLETATQRRSLRKKARLLDFEIHDGRSATTLLAFTVSGVSGTPVPVTAGTPVWALSESSAPIPFEVGLGLHDVDGAGNPTQYNLRVGWNAAALTPFFLDESQVCLPVGATSLYVQGALEGLEIVGDNPGSQLMLLHSVPSDPGVPERVQIVHLTSAKLIADPLQSDQLATFLTWDPADALPFQIDQTSLQLTLNLVPASAGQTLCAEFVTSDFSPNPPPSLFCPGASPVDGPLAVAVERQGPLPAGGSEGDRPTIVLFSLPGTDTQGLGFVGDDLRSTQPEIVLADNAGQTWSFQRTLLEVGPDETAFTLEDGSWRPIITFHTATTDLVHQDYATGLGYTLRFGDGSFGRTPQGLHFVARYRTGPGASANVSSGAITALALPGQTPPAGLVAVSNPLPVTNGVDPEGADEIKNLVPDAYQANVLFALQPGDYGTQAKQLSFVQQADATQRWTGSWPTIFVAADPFGGSALTTDERTELTSWMDCVRQTARDVQVRDPRQLAIDLEITICVQPFAHPSEVLAQVQEVLLGPGTGRRLKGVFHPDNFSFGTPLRRSVIEAAIQGVAGVKSVVAMLVRPRGVRALAPFTDLTLSVAPDQIIRLDNDPVHPENGTLTLLTEGGA
ncbi:MAG TPA: hypothetical protein VHO06_27300 [Polyangia bacterium]|nr:hypothetical protein [Polyangia bacterium]